MLWCMPTTRVSSESRLIVCFSSINIMDPNTNQLSLAHFYRACSIWPSLSIHDVLVPSTRPLVSTAVMTLSRGDSHNKLKLSARVPRPSYFAGQHCYLHVQIMNDTRRTVRSLHLTLIRTTTVYRPQSGKETRGEGRGNDGHVSNNYQSKAFVDEIFESRLAMADPTTRRCASSKGWWAGVSPQERTAFTHSILIPVGSYSSVNDGQAGSFESLFFSQIHCQLPAPNSSLSTILFVSPCTLQQVH